MKTFGATIALWLSTAIPATALEKHCYDDTIGKVSQSGDIVTMISGHLYRINDVDTIDTALWLPSEDVLICEISEMRQGRKVTIYDIINTEQGGEPVWAERLK